MRAFAVCCLAVISLTAWAQPLRTVSGRIVVERGTERIAAATIWVENTDISVVSNSDGYFSIKIPQYVKSLSVKQMGYATRVVDLPSQGDEKPITIRLTELPVVVDGVVVRSGDPLALLSHALSKVRDNYPSQAANLVGFYREMISKNGRYASVVEAVTDIYKSPINLKTDQVRLYKGRRSADYSRVDTLIMQYQGGVSTALMLDFSKHYDNVFWNTDSIATYYTLKLDGVTRVQDRDQFVVSFDQIAPVLNRWDMLFRGTVWIDAQSYAISRVEFARNVEQYPLAYAEFVLKLPPSYRVKMLGAIYVMDYIFDGAKWNYNYSKASIEMKIVAPKRKFSATYGVVSEMVVTDRKDSTAVKFARTERLSPRDMAFDRVVDYMDEQFWEDFNVIEPEQSLETAVKRINRKIDIKR